ncbi:hypothetical protein NMY22_g2124 [Coprinellus aureogranulatus]|nr:hypothetical protein NMY22_g2124 [Coprinellus aureogranulatus]
MSSPPSAWSTLLEAKNEICALLGTGDRLPEMPRRGSLELIAIHFHPVVIIIHTATLEFSRRMGKLGKSVPSSTIASGASNKPTKKKFLGNEDTLNLALSIAESQEKLTGKKKQNRSPGEASVVTRNDHPRPKSTSSRKAKLKETKALLAAKKAQLKKDKVKKRKEVSKPRSPHPHLEVSASKPVRKSVSFA